MSQFANILSISGERQIATPRPLNAAERREDAHIIRMMAIGQDELTEADVRALPEAQGAGEREPLLLMQEPVIMRLYRFDDVIGGSGELRYARLYAMSKPDGDAALGLFQEAKGSEWGEAFFLQRMLVR